MKVAFLFTTHNRREKTRACVESIQASLAYAYTCGITIEDSWYITDAASTDGTHGMITKILDGEKLHVREASDETFYSVGMRMSMEAVLAVSEENGIRPDYLILMNDDVVFERDFLARIFGRKDLGDSLRKESAHNTVLVGAVAYEGRQTYGGIRYRNRGKRLIPKYETVQIDDADKECHTFNANCVVIPYEIFEKVGMMDEKYVHSLGDFDYGMRIYEKGYSIISTDFYVGVCPNNTKEGTWQDVSLARFERIGKLRSVKGAPTGPWFYYLYKHFGICSALKGAVTPYIRILIGK